MAKYSVNAILTLSLAYAAFFFSTQPAKSISGGGVICEAENNGTSALAFRCSVLGQFLQEFIPDRFGGVIRITTTDSSPVEISTTAQGLQGAGGAKVIGSTVQLVDGAGQITHENLSPRSVLSYPNRTSSVAVVGDMTPNVPLSIDLRSPLAEVSSGRAIIVGDSDIINLDVSGRDGLSGRSIETAAALQVLRGDLGTSTELLNLARFDMNLSGAISTPSLSLSDLTGSVGVCEDFSGRELKSFSYPGDATDSEGVSTLVNVGREIVATRNVCERQVSEEFSVQTVCAREPEVAVKVKCDYPDLVRYNQKYARPREYRKTSFSCAQSVPAGTWSTVCAKEETAVVASLVRPEYVSLAPSSSLIRGMQADLLHHYTDLNTEKPCLYDSPLLWDLSSQNNNGLNLYSDYVFSDSTANSGKKIFNYGFNDILQRPSSAVGNNCQFPSFNKMEKLMATGALVFKQPETPFFMPGSKEEDSAPIPSLQKIGYWADQGSATNGRKPTDNNSTSADVKSVYSLLDPNTVPSGSEEYEKRVDYINELTDLGFTAPSYSDATISYSDLRVAREQVSISFEDAICGPRSGAGIKAAGQYRADNHDVTAGKQICKTMVSSLGLNADIISTLKFREKFTYKFTGLRSGLALKRKLTNNSQNVMYRAENEEPVNFWPRALFLAGDLDLKPITKVSYCKELDVDNNPTLLQSGENTRFVFPEMLSGGGISTYKTFFGPGPKESSPQMTSAQGTVGRPFQAPSNLGFQNAPTRLLYGFSQSFVKLSDIPLSSRNCQSVDISHNVSDHERRILNKLKNAASILITSEDDTISVYFSPIRIPRKNKQTITPETSLLVNTGLSPGIYLPEVNVAPARLVAATGNSEIDAAFNYGEVIGAEGYGKPARTDLNTPAWFSDNTLDNSSRLEADFNNGVSFLQLPAENNNATPNSISIVNSETVIVKDFKAIGTRNLSGTRATDTTTPRAATSTPPSMSYAQRLIKTLRKYHLGISFSNGQPEVNNSIDKIPLSTNTANKANDRTYRDVILASKLGIPVSGEASKTCGPGSSDRKLNFRFPTKLITRKIEPSFSKKDLPIGTDHEPNMVNNSEVVQNNVVGYYRNAPIGQFPYFSSAFLPTTALNNNLLSPDEPINLAQDKNHFLAQLQTLSGVSYGGNPGSEVFELKPSTDESYSRYPYVARMSKEATQQVFKEIGKRQKLHPQIESRKVVRGDRGVTGATIIDASQASAVDPTNSGNLIFGVHSREVSVGEYNCLVQNPLNGTSIKDICLTFNESDIFKRYRPPFMFLAAENPEQQVVTIGSNCTCADPFTSGTSFPGKIVRFEGCNLGANRKGTLVCNPSTNTFYTTRDTKPSPFYPVRPWKQTYRGRIVTGFIGGVGDIGSGDPIEQTRTRGWEDGASLPPELNPDTTANKAEESLQLGTWRDNLTNSPVNNDYFAGQFLPMFRTNEWIFFPGEAELDTGEAPESNSYQSANFFRNSSSEPLSLGQQVPVAKSPKINADQSITIGTSNAFSLSALSENYSGGLFLPAITGQTTIRFGKFIVARNVNGLMTDDVENGTFQSNWQGSHYREVNAAFGLFYGTDRFRPNSYAKDPSGKLNKYNPESGTNQTDDSDSSQEPYSGEFIGEQLAQPDFNNSTATHGYSGYMFEDCSDTLDPVSTFSAKTFEDHRATTLNDYRANLSGNFANGKEALNIGDASRFPFGLRLSMHGGLFYGPLAGEQLRPIEDKISGLNNQLYLGISVAGDDSKREQFGVPVYKEGSVTEKIIKATSSGNTSLKSEQTTNRVMKTVGRIIIDAKDELALSNLDNNPRYQYEPEIVLLPEVLAALFLHSDFGDMSNLGNNLYPLAARGNNDTKPDYFSELVSDFLGPVVKNELQTVLFRNKLVSGTDPVTENAVKSAVLTFNSFPTMPSFKLKNNLSPVKSVPTFRISWEITNESIFASVLSYNISTRPSAQTGSSLVGNIDNQELASGAAVIYNASIYGDQNDTADLIVAGGAESGRPTRRQGLELPEIRIKPLKTVAISSVTQDGGGGTEGNFPIQSAVDLTQTPANRSEGYFFAEAICGPSRSEFLTGSRKSFNVTGDLGSSQLKRQIFDKICIAAAVRGNAGVIPTCNSITCPVENPFGNDLNRNPDNSAPAFESVSVEKNVYWEIAKNDVETTNISSNSPASPPSCSLLGTGFRLIQQIYNSDANSGGARRIYNIEETPSSVWNALIGSSGEPECPVCNIGENCNVGEEFYEISRSYTGIFQNPSLCYDPDTGVAIQDTRIDKTNSICTKPANPCSVGNSQTRSACLADGGTWIYPDGYNHTGVVFFATTIEADPSPFVEDGSLAPSPTSSPGSSYTIYQGAVVSSRRGIGDLMPSASTLTLEGESTATYDNELDVWWVKQGTLFNTPQCRALPYTTEGVIDLSGDSLPLLRPRSSYTERLNRYGVLDTFIGKTKFKQIRLPISSQTNGADQALLALADSCDFSTIEPETSIPQIRPDLTANQVESITNTPDITDMNYAIDYILIKGATSGLTTRQYTPWSTERTDSSLGTPVSCDVFNNEEDISQEQKLSLTSSSLPEDRQIEIGQGSQATRFAINLPASPDTSVKSDGSIEFVTGGTWIPVGTEDRTITADEPVPVKCEFKLDSAFGPDSCEAPIPITYETNDGFNVVINAEDGEHGSHAGSGVVLTSLPVRELNIRSQGGAGGQSGSTTVSGISGDRRLICYEKSTETTNPWIRIYRFSKALIDVSPGVSGNGGAGGPDRVFYGWGIMPEASKFLQKQLLDNAKEPTSN